MEIPPQANNDMPLALRRAQIRSASAKTWTSLAIAAGFLGLTLVCSVAIYEVSKPGFLGAREGLKYIIANLVTVALAGRVIRDRSRTARRAVVALAGSTGLTAVVLVVSASGNLASALIAGATLASGALAGSLIWRIGWIGPCPWPAAITLGCGAIGVVEFLLGIAGWLNPWTGAWPVLAVALGVVVHSFRSTSARARCQRRTSGFITFLAASPISAAAFCVLVISAVWESIWASGPEIQYDALYAKAWLPALWASTGHIQVQTYTAHPQMGETGTAELLALPGHLLAQPATGRFLQFLIVLLLPTAVWWWASRTGSRLAPVWAAVVGLTPNLSGRRVRRTTTPCLRFGASLSPSSSSLRTYPGAEAPSRQASAWER